MNKLSFSIPGVLPSSSPQTLPVPSGLPSNLTGGLDTTGNSAFQVAISWIFYIAIVIAVVVLILSGIQWITSKGDPQRVAKAKSRLTYSIIGLIVVAAAFLIVNIVVTILGGDTRTLINTR